MKLWLYLHLFTILPCLLLAPAILFRKKGDSNHKTLGRTWAYLMIFSSALSFGIQSHGTFSWLHGLAAFTILSVMKGVLAARKGNFSAHKRSMIGAYVGSVIAFMFALSPNRFLGSWFFEHLK
jgi:uncharacterized membrane protein